VKGDPLARIIMSVAATSVVLVSAVGFMELAHADPCPDTRCNDGITCGGSGATPGYLNICGSENEGDECNHCDGTASIRYCGGNNAHDKECQTVAAADRTACGNSKKGVCTKHTVPFVGITYYSCDKTSGNGDADACKSAQQCSGTDDCD
jgi:hypothetical protein